MIVDTLMPEFCVPNAWKHPLCCKFTPFQSQNNSCMYQNFNGRILEYLLIELASKAERQYNIL